MAKATDARGRTNESALVNLQLGDADSKSYTGGDKRLGDVISLPT
jgi:hypothetical protein